MENNCLDDYLNQDKNNVVIVYNYFEASYRFRKRVRELSREYNFSYILSFFGRGNYNEDYGKLLKLIGKDIMDDNNKMPILFITNNGKVVDYTTDIEKNKIKEFLIKNKIIS